jgi:hypothetical protein
MSYTDEQIKGELLMAEVLAENGGPYFPSNFRVLIAIIEQLRAENVRLKDEKEKPCKGCGA